MSISRNATETTALLAKDQNNRELLEAVRYIEKDLEEALEQLDQPSPSAQGVQSSQSSSEPHAQQVGVQPSLSERIMNTLRLIGSRSKARANMATTWAKQHPWLLLLAVLASAQNGINAFTSTPEKMATVVRSLSAREWALSLTKLISSWLINAIINAFFLSTAHKKIKTIYKDLLQNPREKPLLFLLGILYLFLACAAALAAATVCYKAFGWLPEAIYFAAVPAFFSLGINFASRLVGVSSAFTALITGASKAAKVKRKLIDIFQHINLSNPEVNQRFRIGFNQLKQNREFAEIDRNTELTPEQFEKFIVLLAKFISANKNDFILDATTNEINLNHLHQFLQCIYVVAIIVLLAAPYSFSYLKNGSDGLNIFLNLIGKIIHKDWGITNFSTPEQLAFGIPSLIATGLLVIISWWDIPDSTAQILKELHKKPEKIIDAIAFLAFNIFAAYSPRSVAEAVALDFKLSILFSLFFIWASTITGFGINARYSMSKILLEQKTVTIDNIVPIDVLNWLQDPNTILCDKAANDLLEETNLFPDEFYLPHPDRHGEHIRRPSYP